MWLTISFSLFFRLRLRRGERSTNYVYVSQGDWSLLSFDEKNRKNKIETETEEMPITFMFSQDNWSLLSFDEKNRKIKGTKKRQIKMQGRPFTGQLMHLPGVSCDNFSGENRNNDQFFLSHCHTGNRITYVQTYWPFLHDTKKCQSGYWVYTLRGQN